MRHGPFPGPAGPHPWSIVAALLPGLLLTLAGSGQPAGAQDEPLAKITAENRMRFEDYPGELFDMLDTDDSGALDRDEAAFDVELRKQFRQADTDTDDGIDREEYRDFHETEVRRIKRGERSRLRPPHPSLLPRAGWWHHQSHYWS